MQTVGIVCEFNPLHRGHAYLLAAVRRQYPEALILCVMSGSLCQRGSFAVFDKYLRAETAVRMGADLVVELPFPWSMGSAEFFANGAVSLLGAFDADTVAFGAESADTALLCSAADHLGSETFREAFDAARTAENANVGYPMLQERVFRTLYGDAEASLLTAPNTSLALAYLAGAKRQKLSLTPFAVKRIGGGHHAEAVTDGEAASAAAIRRLLTEGQTDAALDAVPAEAARIYRNALACGNAVLSEDRAFPLLLWHCQTTPPDVLTACAGMENGLAARFRNASSDAVTFEELLSLAMTKTHTRAACRRALWNGFFGVTTEQLRAVPSYTVLLAADKRGTAYLSGHTPSVPVLTKPASVKSHTEAVRQAFSLSHRAEALRAMLTVIPTRESELYRVKPYIMS